MYFQSLQRGTIHICNVCRSHDISIKTISLVFSLVRKEQGKVLSHLVQQFRGVSLGFLTGVCVNIHCGRHIRMTKKLLHVLRRCAVGQQDRLACGPLYSQNYYLSIEEKNRTYYEVYSLPVSEHPPEGYQAISLV